MMAPRLVTDLDVSWLISTNEGESEALVSSNERAALLIGNSARRVLAGASPSDALGPQTAGRQIEWDADPLILTDSCEGDGDPIQVWSTADHLCQELNAADRSCYVIAAQLITDFFEALISARPCVPLTPVLAYGRRLIIGPTLWPNRSPCARCWARRLRANLPTLDQRLRRKHRLREQGFCLRTTRGVIKALWEVPAPLRPPDWGLIVDFQTGAVTRQRLIPFPDCHLGGHPTPGRIDDFLGDVLGIVTATGSPSEAVDLPLAIVTAVCRDSTTRVSGAASGFHREATKQRAMYEAAERLAASHVEQGVFWATHAELADAPALTDLTPFTNDQYMASTNPYTPLAEDTVIPWLHAKTLSDNNPTSIPAQLVTLDPRYRHPAFSRVSSTGIAAGPNLPLAVCKALLEIAERDIVTRCWYAGDMKRLPVEDWAPSEAARLCSAGLEVRIAVCEHPLRLPSVVANLRRLGAKNGGAYGCAADMLLAQAVPHAIEEAVQMLVYREAHNSPCPVDPLWETLEEFNVDTDRYLTGHLPTLIEWFRPVALDLTCQATRAVSTHVASLWSPVAVDFPRVGEPLFLKRWQPSGETLHRLEATPNIFSGEGY